MLSGCRRSLLAAAAQALWFITNKHDERLKGKAMTTHRKIWDRIRRYAPEKAGTIAIMFAIMAPILFGVAGMSLDYAQAYLVKQRLGQALDAAALAAAASSTDESVITQRVLDFFEANYPDEKLGVTFEPSVQIIGDEVIVTGQAYYDTMFLSVIGIDTIDVSAETTVLREVQGLEVVMVLDNTGSMAWNNNMDALKAGTENFINILFDHTSDPNNIKIGMVPYSNSVRVGKYGLGETPDGDTYGDGTPFVTLPSDVSYTTNHSSSTGWYGCVIEHKEDGYEATATHVPNTYGQFWMDGANWDGHGWSPTTSVNDPYDYDVLDNYEGPWDIYMYGSLDKKNYYCRNSRCSDCGSDNYCDAEYCFCRNSRPNSGCPYAYIMPMTSDQTALIDHIDEMVPDGNTLGNIGMAWGARLISPDFPFEEGVAWDNQYWKKAIVMMTDGDNTLNSTYSSYWFTNKNDMTVTKFNQRFVETCQALKDNGVTIYTVTFTSGINDNTKDYYRDCASSESQYFDAPTQSELIEVFETIARELSNLHIKN
jgi:Flp pilus assembly protein TadG